MNQALRLPWHHTCRRSRKGAMLMLVAVSLIILLVAAAFSVDIAYMHLTREELHIATDAAAKAAVTGLSLGGTQEDAVRQAIDYAAKNRVAGAPLKIDAANVKIGGVTYNSGSRWAFTEGAKPYTAASVTVHMASGSTPGAVNLFFGRFLGTSTFSPTMTSTAAFVRNKVCLCFDRSRSMTFDTTGSDESWPTSESGWPQGVPSSAANVKITTGSGSKKKSATYDFRYLYPPCNNSRWYYLTIAANTFLDALSTSTMETPVALVTWGYSTDNASSKDLAGNYHTYAGTALQTSSSTTSYSSHTIDSTFVTTYTGMRNALAAKTGTTMLGGTDMNAGLQAAVDLFASTEDKLPWNKIIILFSDGYYTTSTNPATSAAVNAKKANIVVHTVGFLLNSTDKTRGEQTLKDIANVTGGRYYCATNGASLKAAFEELARTLPVILTQ